MRHFSGWIATATLVWVGTMGQAADDTILTIERPDDSGAAVEYSLAELKEMGAVTFQTTTPWTEGEQSFTGVPFATLVSGLGLADGTLLVTAVNDYAVEFPVGDALKDGPVIAYLRNGAPMSVRDKGPLWIVYPYDSKAEFRTETVYSRSVWQLDRIVVNP
ncbi:oxidoreductase [Shimia sp. SDUM112013]|uniref:oxidoreductase n=1 Tax=Shimia sp. SDUM112013 TaxID=3136160 RepID=UPI0032EBD426